MVCFVCKKSEGKTRILTHFGPLLCEGCTLGWCASVEWKRLQSISQSLLAEWLERRRCEENVEKERNQTEGAKT